MLPWHFGTFVWSLVIGFRLLLAIVMALLGRVSQEKFVPLAHFKYPTFVLNYQEHFLQMFALLKVDLALPAAQPYR